jgi:exosome complex component RRP42
MSTPFADTPDEGTLMVNAEFTPLASPDFEAGPPGEEAIELARVVDRGIRESESLDLKKLCITPKEKVWSVCVDIHIINHQGNLLDCAALASMTALLNTRIPKVEEDAIVRGEFSGNLEVKHKPINVNVCKIGDKLFLDPTFEEEGVTESKLAVAVREDDKICALQKQGSFSFTVKDIERMVDLAMAKSRELRRLIG